MVASEGDSASAAEKCRSALPKRARWKTWLFAGVTVLLVGGCIELLSFGALHLMRSNAALSRIRRDQRSLAAGRPLEKDTNETIHPYTGWSFNPDVSDGIEFAGRRIPVNVFGLLDDKSSIQKRGSDRLVIGITGGSVAWQMSVAGERKLQETLRTCPEFADRQIVIVRCGLSGYKQPQQLMTLTWLLAEGAQFDAVVNVDGFNEAALTILQNHAAGVNIAYPASWHARTVDIVDPRHYAPSFELWRLRATRQRLAQNALQSPFRWSSTYNLIWLLRDQHIQEKKLELGFLLIAGHDKPGGRGFLARGPVETFADESNLDRAVVQLWANCSVQLDRLCTANRILYLHVLQPNQYLPESKRLSQEERDRCYRPDLKEAPVIARLYPEMIAAGEELREQGVSFVDLTQLFADVHGTIYADVICHYNQRGNDTLAQAVAERLIDLFQSARTRLDE